MKRTKTRLATVDDEMVPQGIKLSVLHTREQVGVVAAFAQLHDDIQDHRATGAAAASRAIDHIDVSKENVPVNFLLLRRQPCGLDIRLDQITIVQFWRFGVLGFWSKCKQKKLTKRAKHVRFC